MAILENSACRDESVSKRIALSLPLLSGQRSIFVPHNRDVISGICDGLMWIAMAIVENGVGKLRGGILGGCDGVRTGL